MIYWVMRRSEYNGEPVAIYNGFTEEREANFYCIEGVIRPDELNGNPLVKRALEILSTMYQEVRQIGKAKVIICKGRLQLDNLEQT